MKGEGFLPAFCPNQTNPTRMKSIRRVSLGFLCSLALMSLLPSCVVVDPGYVSVSTGYNSGYRSSGYYAPQRVVQSSYYDGGYCAPPVQSCHQHYDSCYTPPPCGYRHW
jgi:hypothetical protein